MSNIVTLDRTQVAQTESPIMFRVYERPLAYLGKNRGDFYGAHEWKALVRTLPNSNDPHCLNIVGKNYKTVQNAELFGAIDQGIFNTLGNQGAGIRCQVKDKVAYRGRNCYREYIFDDLVYEGPEKQEVRFRIIALNAFGSGAIRLYAGAIDMFCLNGMIHGEFFSTYAKHTSGLTLGRFTRAVENSINVFWKQRDLPAKLKAQAVNNNDVYDWMHEQFGKQLGWRLYQQYVRETAKRGRNLWAVFSALIYYSSHSDGKMNNGVEFALRNTGNDHAAASMLGREQRVNKIIEHEDFYKLAA